MFSKTVVVQFVYEITSIKRRPHGIPKEYLVVMYSVTLQQLPYVAAAFSRIPKFTKL